MPTEIRFNRWADRISDAVDSALDTVLDHPWIALVIGVTIGFLL